MSPAADANGRTSHSHAAVLAPGCQSSHLGPGRRPFPACGPDAASKRRGDVPMASELTPARETAQSAARTGPPMRRVALSVLIGTTIEWYDFQLYGIAAALVIAP